MSVLPAWFRRFVPGLTALVLIAALFAVAKSAVASTSGGEAAKVASHYKFTRMPIAMPPGYHPAQSVRPVNPAYQHIRSWISSIGSSVALTDLTGKGRDDDICLVDPRTDKVIVSYAPTAPQSEVV